MVYKHITELIGNTPILEIDPKVHGLKNIQLYAKLEYFNPFGSVKDRIAWGMLKDDIGSIIKEKRTILEASSGNTAKALQILASIYGVKFKTFSNRVNVREVKQVLQLLGTEIEEFSGLSECPDPNALDGVFAALHKQLVRNPKKYFHPSQYTNQKNINTHFAGTGKEIQADLGKVDYLIGGLGTTGSTRGIAECLKHVNPTLKTIGVVSGENDFIPGIRSEKELWEVGLFQREFYDQILTIESRDAVTGSLDLMRRCGILAGPTSGAAFTASLQYLRNIDSRLKHKSKAVFIACDRAEWYLSYYKLRRPEIFGYTKNMTSRSLPQTAVEAAKEIKPKELSKLMKNGCTIVDMRNNAQFRLMHIKGSVNLPEDELENLLGRTLPFSKGLPVVVVCLVGKQSKRFAALLTRLNYKAYNLAGGILSWRSEKLPLETLETKI